MMHFADKLLQRLNSQPPFDGIGWDQANRDGCHSTVFRQQPGRGAAVADNSEHYLSYKVSQIGGSTETTLNLMLSG